MFIAMPLMLMTMVDARRNWSSLWNSHLTQDDRHLLMRISMFLLMPIVVFFHEMGHAVAILQFNGIVKEFHYGILWGYVIPAGLFTQEQILFIYLAGNLVEIIIGFALLGAAFMLSSPPVVALLVYLGLWSIGGTVIVYALMSIFGMYGDWIAIYQSPVRDWVTIIAVCHAVVVAMVLWCVYGKRPRLWFAMKTQPEWADEFKSAAQKAKIEKSWSAYLDAAWLLYKAGLDSLALDYVKQSLKIDGGVPDPLFLQGLLYYNQDNLEKAEECFLKGTRSNRASDLLRARLFIGIGRCKADKTRKASRTKEETYNLLQEALQAFSQATLAQPDLADPRFLRAMLLNRSGRYQEAEDELQSLQNLRWLDASLKRHVPEELDIAGKMTVKEQ